MHNVRKNDQCIMFRKMISTNYCPYWTLQSIYCVVKCTELAGGSCRALVLGSCECFFPFDLFTVLFYYMA